MQVAGSWFQKCFLDVPSRPPRKDRKALPARLLAGGADPHPLKGPEWLPGCLTGSEAAAVPIPAH